MKQRCAHTLTRDQATACAFSQTGSKRKRFACAHGNYVLVYEVLEKEKVSLALICKFITDAPILSLLFYGSGAVFALTPYELQLGVIQLAFPAPLAMHTLLARAPNAHVVRESKLAPQDAAVTQLNPGGKSHLPFSSPPSLVCTFDLALDVEDSAFLPLPLVRAGPAFASFLGARGTDIFYETDGVCKSYVVSSPGLKFALLASNGFPDLALKWTQELVTGKEACVVLLERLGFPAHATRVTAASLSLLLDVCIKNELDAEIRRLFYLGARKKKQAKQRLKALAMEREPVRGVHSCGSHGLVD